MPTGGKWFSLIKQLGSVWFPGARISGCPNVSKKRVRFQRMRGLSTKRLDFDDSGQPRSVQGISQNQNISCHIPFSGWNAVICGTFQNAALDPLKKCKSI